MKNLVLMLLAASAVLSAAEHKKIVLPKPYATPSAANGAKIIPQPEGKKLQALEGFVAEEYAANFKRPRFMVQLPCGTVLVSDTVAQGSIIAIGADVQGSNCRGLHRARPHPSTLYAESRSGNAKTDNDQR